MIGYLEGKIANYDGQMVTVMVGGIGFEVMMPRDGATLYDLGQEVGIYTYMHVRENDIGLYGFENALDKQVFNLLIGVSGIGPKSAVQMLGVAGAKDVLSAIRSENEKLLSSLPGIGKKTSARIILELKEKVDKLFPELPIDKSESTGKKTTKAKSSIEDDLTDTLMALGYRSNEIKLMYESTDVLEETEIDRAIKRALQFLARG